jgi:hypothetical protein
VGGTGTRGAHCVSRKTFSGNGRPGRKRKDGPRQPNGQLRRVPEAETAAQIVAIALAQPHRRGDPDPRRHWPVGRLILDQVVKHSDLSPAVLERAASRYAADYSRLQRALASRRPLAVTDGGGGFEDPDMLEREHQHARWAWANVQRALRDAGERTVKACEMAILDLAPDFDEATLAQWIILSLPAGLGTLAKFYELD